MNALIHQILAELWKEIQNNKSLEKQVIDEVFVFVGTLAAGNPVALTVIRLIQNAIDAQLAVQPAPVVPPAA